MTPLKYKCVKCAGEAYDLGEIRAAGGFWSKIFDVQGRRFTTVTCQRCKYTEFFRADSSMIGTLFDLFT